MSAVPPGPGAQPKKSILKKTSKYATEDEEFGVPRSGVLWDESNIALTEAGKDSTMKITEPKTPFVVYDEAGDEVVGARGGAGQAPSLALLAEKLDGAIMARDRDDSGDGSEGSSASSSASSSVGSSPARWWEGGTGNPADYEDPPEQMTEAERRKKDKFNQMRKMHYNVGAALKRRAPAKPPPNVDADESMTLDGEDSDSDNDKDNEGDDDEGKEAED